MQNEVIVPVSMAPLQKEVYRSILSMFLELSYETLSDCLLQARMLPSSRVSLKKLLELRKPLPLSNMLAST